MTVIPGDFSICIYMQSFFPHTYQLPIVTLVTTRNETFLLSHSITADPSTTFSHPKSLLNHKKKGKKRKKKYS